MNSSISTSLYPGGEWVYIEVSANWLTLDCIISTYWSEMVGKMVCHRLIKKAFFVRFFDKVPLLRIRFQLHDAKFSYSVLDLFKETISPLINESYIWDIRLSTYKREYLRYNEKLIEDTEALFALDSEVNAQIISICKKTSSKNDITRVLASALLVDYYLDLFHYTLLQKQQVLGGISEMVKHMYRLSKENRKQINEKYRLYKNQLRDVLEGKSLDSCIGEIRQVLCSYLEPFRLVAANLLARIEYYNLDQKFLISSYMHMSLNRLFIIKGHIYELFVYDFLTRYYLSKNIRESMKIQ